MKFKRLERGQTIIEAVVALSLIIVVLTAISILVVSSVANSQFIKNQSLASKYANQGLENLRYLRNNPPPAPTPTFDNYAGTSPQTPTYCMCANGVIGDNDCNIGVTAGASCIRVDDFSGVPFKREVTFAKNTVDCSNVAGAGTRVTISVYWTSGKCPAGTSNNYCHKSQLVSCLADPSESGAQL